MLISQAGGNSCVLLFSIFSPFRAVDVHSLASPHRTSMYMHAGRTCLHRQAEQSGSWDTRRWRSVCWS